MRLRDVCLNGKSMAMYTVVNHIHFNAELLLLMEKETQRTKIYAADNYNLAFIIKCTMHLYQNIVVN